MTNAITLASDITTDVLITFRTSDGFTLSLVSQGEQWTDNDMVFDADENGWPVDDQGNRLEGSVRRHYYEADRTIYLDHDGTRTVVQGYGDGESWWKTVVMPVAVYEAWKAQMIDEGYGEDYLHPMACLEHLGHLQARYDGGPGRAFCGSPHLDREGPKWIVANQRGGLDI